MDKKILDKIILVGDIHFGLRSNSFDAMNITISFFDKLLIPFIEKQVEIYGKDKISLIFTGDINDNKQLINTLIHNVEVTIFRKIGSIIDTFIILGNHDMPYDDVKLITELSLEIGGTKLVINSCESFDDIPGITVIRQPEILQCINNQKALLHPFIEKINNPSDFDCDFGFSHIEIAQFSYDGKMINESEHINRISDFSRFKKFFSGHLHKHQEKSNVYYIGSVYQTKKSEANNNVGFMFLDLENGSYEWIKNDISPKYVNIHFDFLLEMRKSELEKLVYNNFVTVLVSSDITYKINQSEIQKSISGYRTLEFLPISDYIKEIRSDNLLSDNIDIDEVVLYGSLTDKINEFVDQLQIVRVNNQPLQIDSDLKTKINNKLQEIYNEVSSQLVDEIEIN